VRFQIAAVFLPSPGGVPLAIEEDQELEGTILDFSDSGSKPRIFAVVEVVRTQSYIVPVERLEVIEANLAGDKS
jgi:hypothetical protein